jgi:hypothetical protein
LDKHRLKRTVVSTRFDRLEYVGEDVERLGLWSSDKEPGFDLLDLTLQHHSPSSISKSGRVAFTLRRFGFSASVGAASEASPEFPFTGRLAT